MSPETIKNEISDKKQLIEIRDGNTNVQGEQTVLNSL